MKVDARRLLWTNRRPVAFRAEDIGWKIYSLVFTNETLEIFSRINNYDEDVFYHLPPRLRVFISCFFCAFSRLHFFVLFFFFRAFLQVTSSLFFFSFLTLSPVTVFARFFFPARSVTFYFFVHFLFTSCMFCFVFLFCVRSDRVRDNFFLSFMTVTTVHLCLFL